MFRLVFTDEASGSLAEIEGDGSKAGLLKQVYKALGYLETNPRHPGLKTHEYSSLAGPHRENVFEAYAQNRTPGAHRIFFHYGPDEESVVQGKKRRVPVITIIAITPHP